MFRFVLISVVVAVALAGCVNADVTPPPSAALPHASGSATPSAAPVVTSPRAPQARVPFAWARLTGLDLRGAVVATAAKSATTTLLIGADIKSGARVVWTSTDGATFERHWLDAAAFGGGIPQRLIAGGPGFVAFGWDVTPALATAPVVWTSPNGIDWSRDADPSGHFDTDLGSVAATASTVVVSTCCRGNEGSTLLASTDGVTWHESTPPGGDHAAPFLVAASGGTFLAVADAEAPDADHLIRAAWRSSDGVAWVRDPQVERGLATISGINALYGTTDGFGLENDSGGAGVIEADGSVTTVRAPAEMGTLVGGWAGLGWILPGEDGACTSAWRLGTDGWAAVGSRGACPTAPELGRVVGTSDGWIVVGAASRGGTDDVWALRPADGPSGGTPPDGPPPVPPSTAIAPVPTEPLAPGAPCPDAPLTLVKLVALDGNDRVACFGSRRLAFRAWVVDPGEGYGGACEVVNPEWLQVCVLPAWWLAPSKTSKSQLLAVQRPDATGDLKGVRRWVAVTGHFDDPAAGTCRPAAGPGLVEEAPLAWFVFRCREQFVVTRLDTAK